jgi:hypothetical protein
MSRPFKNHTIFWIAPDEDRAPEFVARRVGNHIGVFPYLHDVPPDRAMITRKADGFTIIISDWHADSWQLPEAHWRNFFQRAEMRLFGEVTP